MTTPSTGTIATSTARTAVDARRESQRGFHRLSWPAAANALPEHAQSQIEHVRKPRDPAELSEAGAVFAIASFARRGRSGVDVVEHMSAA